MTTPGTKEKQVLFESLKGTGASQVDGSIPAHSAQQLGILGNSRCPNPLGNSTALKPLMAINSLPYTLPLVRPRYRSGAATGDTVPTATAQSLLHSCLGQTNRSRWCTAAQHRHRKLGQGTKGHRSRKRAHPACLPLPAGRWAAQMAIPPCSSSGNKTRSCSPCVGCFSPS